MRGCRLHLDKLKNLSPCAVSPLLYFIYSEFFNKKVDKYQSNIIKI